MGCFIATHSHRITLTQRKDMDLTKEEMKFVICCLDDYVTDWEENYSTNERLIPIIDKLKTLSLNVRTPL